MDLIVTRQTTTPRQTGGMLYVDGALFCMTLEDTFRHEKLAGETRVPTGRYNLKLRRGSPMSNRYLQKYGTDGMIWLQDVPGFKWVYLHVGNTEDDTEGCILVGDGLYSMVKDGGELNVNLTNSVTAYLKLHQIVAPAIDRGEPSWITVLG